MDASEIVANLRRKGKKCNVEGMARYGIRAEGNLGASIADIRALAGELGSDHALAGELWATGIRDARMVAALIEEPEKVSDAQLEEWVAALNSWDLCDHTCWSLFGKMPNAYELIRRWSQRDEEFVRRAPLAMLAWLSIHDKKASDQHFESFLPLIENAALDGRNYVKKAASWALRNVGKRNRALNKAAVKSAKKLAGSDSPPARWVGRDALRELEGEKVQARLAAKAARDEARLARLAARKNGRGKGVGTGGASGRGVRRAGVGARRKLAK